jgi:hypothetical protein
MLAVSCVSPEIDPSQGDDSTTTSTVIPANAPVMPMKLPDTGAA